MFSNLARPKAIFSMWLIIQERMLTADRLSKWNMNVDTTCVFCKCQPEHHHHLFYNCSTIMEVWCDIFKWLQIPVPANTWSQLLCWFVGKAKKKTAEGQLLRMVLAETVQEMAGFPLNCLTEDSDPVILPSRLLGNYGPRWDAMRRKKQNI
ncbi:PREDICTED: uncharacterized protein LOC109242902 [Nicotiana attenuata]|uniref:uncharacterized protein LOC109242902 n=1 Tax=Nicotiana attenuata TaxID=49451 RepID=UPI0009046B71|nr:PREDICTED: uncharacterized protein LOC109242902 [Nicotiana attenuata]